VDTGWLGNPPRTWARARKGAGGAAHWDQLRRPCETCQMAWPSNGMTTTNQNIPTASSAATIRLRVSTVVRGSESTNASPLALAIWILAYSEERRSHPSRGSEDVPCRAQTRIPRSICLGYANPLIQGNESRLTTPRPQDLQQIIGVSRGALAAPLDGSLVVDLAHEIEGEVTDHGHVGSAVTGAQA
jgi:hypothetical protein